MAVVLMCGPSGAGKSVHARRLEEQGWVRLSIDVEAWDRGVRTLPVPLDLLREIEADLVRRLTQAVGRDRDVVVDFPFATRALRDDYRTMAVELGVEAETVFVPVDRDVAITRLRARRGSGPDDYRLDESALAAHLDAFEAPAFDEHPLLVLDGDLSFRHARLADVPDLLDFWVEAAENDARPQDSPPALEQLMLRDPASVIVVEHEGRVRGSIIAGWDGWRAHLYRLAVHPDLRGRGVARRLLGHAERRLVALGATRFDAMVLDHNDGGAALWRSAGYAPQGEWSRWVKPAGPF